MIDITAPVHALPLDIARILIGGVLFFYFLGALRQARDFSDPDGLIDHRLSMRLLPPTRISLFQPGMPGVLFRIVFLLACVASLFVVAGYHPRAAAFFLFLAAVSNYRWNVLVAYLDDAIIHIFCLWLVLLPVGHTLNLPDLLAGGPAARSVGLGGRRVDLGDGSRPRPARLPRQHGARLPGRRTLQVHEPDVAGRLRHARGAEDADRPRARVLDPRVAHALRLVTFGALILEPLFALIFVLPAGSIAKWPLVAGAVCFHLGIALTLKIPYSNTAMLGALPLALGPEIMQGALGLPPLTGAPALGLAPSGVVAVTLVVLLVIMLLWDIVETRKRLMERYSSRGWHNPVHALLWMGGLFQSYRLFDWVDARNYHVRFEVRRIGDAVEGRHLVDPEPLFPHSMRHLLLQSYLIGNIWLQLSPERLEAVRRSLLVRHARRYARAHPEAGPIDVVAVVQRVTADNLELTRGERQPLMRFTCRGGEAVMHFPR